MRLLRLPVAPGVVPLLAGTALLALASPGPLQAHGIESSLERVSLLANPARATGSKPGRAQAGTFQLESRFSTGEPARSATVRLVPPQGDAIELGQTDAQGQLQFQVPRQAESDWEVQVDAGPGHRDYLELQESQGGVTAALTKPDARRLAWLQRWPGQPSQLLVGLTGVGLGAVGLLGLSRRRR